MRKRFVSMAVLAVACGTLPAVAWANDSAQFPWTGAAAKAAAAAATPPTAKEGASPPAVTPAKAANATPVPDGGTAAQAARENAAPPAAKENAAPVIPAKKIFGAMKAPADMKARAIGAYSRGCLAGAKALPIDGTAWQAMRLSRNRNWGHPKLIALLEKYAGEVKEKDGWPGLLVGDISQPRGGPMLTGHASHQLGLDADIWFTPMPSRRLSKTERENLAATSMLASDNLSVNKKVWGDGQVKIVRRVASYPDVERVLVHPAIKKALCEAGDTDRKWLAKVRPYWGHFYHFHVRIGCPPDSPSCTKQAPIPGDDGCGKELDDWYKLLTAPPKPKPRSVEPVKPVKPKPPLTLADLPAECRDVVGDDAAIETASPQGKSTPAKAVPAPKTANTPSAPAKKTKSAGTD
ncbi:MAG: penicillin-insensitive murein endopeptidase [Hyphomicrobium sp.]|nr:MAG: penicillin-insensitive murein endopeptidase [Hyphomicrobium sp.]